MAGRRRRPSSRAGAHFLDPRRAAELAAAAAVRRGELVLDLGAGHGALTAALAGRGARVIAVERDPRCLAVLRRRFAGSDVVVVERDLVELALPARPYVVVANIPFAITTPLLGRLLDSPRTVLQRAHLVLAHGAARELARPRAASARTVWWSVRYRMRMGMRLPAHAFSPPPATDAAVLVAEQRALPLVPRRDWPALQGLLACGLRRRSLPFDEALAPVFTRRQLHRLAADLGIDVRDPAGSLTVDQWASVTATMVQLVERSRWPRQQLRFPSA